MNSLKICIITHQYGNFWSGVGTYATRLINALAEKGHSVSVVCPDVSKSKSHSEVNIVEMEGLKIKPTLGNWIILSYHFNKTLQRLLKKESFDIIHFVDARDSFFCKPKGIPVVGTMNDYYFAEASKNPLSYRRHYDDWLTRSFFYNITRVLEKRAIKKLSMVIANCNYIKESVIRNYYINEKLIKMIYYGIEKPDIAAYKVKKGEKLKGHPSILFVGQNFRRKGLPALINAVAEVKKVFPEVSLHVVGKVSEEKEGEMRELGRSLKIEENIHFLGRKDNEEVKILFTMADIFAMPSLIEGLPWAFLEAMSAGVPVIGGKTGGIPEQIEDGVNGFLVEPGDWKDLANKIIKIAGDAVSRERFIQNSFSALDKFSLDRMTEETVGVYHKLIK